VFGFHRGTHWAAGAPGKLGGTVNSRPQPLFSRAAGHDTGGMSMVVYLALIAAAVVALRHGPGRALLNVYLPVLLLIPDGFRAITPGLPDPNFSQAAIIPIVAVALQRHWHRYRAAPMDLLILLFAVWVGWSDYTGRGYDDAQNLMFAMLFSVLAPYFVARLVISAEGLHVAVARRFVIIVFGVALVGLWEARFGFNPFHALIGNFFPGQGQGWVTTFRYGLARVAGPYSHAILAGIMMAVAFVLQRWLHSAGHWEPRFKYLPALPWPKARLITVALVAGMLLTVARGPWLGAVVAAALFAVGQAADRKRALMIAAAVLAVGAVAGGWALADYLDIKPGTVMTMSQESAFYRKVLFEKYLDIALAHSWFGWGLTTWPKVRGMESIDNYYLLISLMHGLPAMAMLVLLMLGSAAQCLRRGLAEPPGSHGPGFAFAGIFLAIFASLGTVYLGEQVLPTLFFMLGWAQGWLRAGPSATAPAGAVAARVAPRFRHVIQ
jgi:hypothetical protein